MSAEGYADAADKQKKAAQAEAGQKEMTDILRKAAELEQPKPVDQKPEAAEPQKDALRPGDQPGAADDLSSLLTKTADLDQKRKAGQLGQGQAKPAEGSADRVLERLTRSGAQTETAPFADGTGGAQDRSLNMQAGAADKLRVGVDKFYDSANLEYTVGKDHVRARPFFRITDGGDISSVDAWEKVKKDAGRRDKPFNDAARMSAYGRPTLDQLQMVTQTLIDKGKLADIQRSHPGLSAEDQIKTLQWENGIGMDCAGYVQQAFLQVHGGERTDYGFDAKIGNENLWRKLPRNKEHFDTIAPEKSRSGDLLILNPPKDEPNTGHTTIIRDRRLWEGSSRSGISDPSSFAGAHDEVHLFEVDSSFGAGDGDLSVGGLQRRQWLFNKTRGKWAEINNNAIEPSSGTGPYDHPYQNIYRPKK